MLCLKRKVQCLLVSGFDANCKLCKTAAGNDRVMDRRMVFELSLQGRKGVRAFDDIMISSQPACRKSSLQRTSAQVTKHKNRDKGISCFCWWPSSLCCIHISLKEIYNITALISLVPVLADRQMSVGVVNRRVLSYFSTAPTGRCSLVLSHITPAEVLFLILCSTRSRPHRRRASQTRKLL